MLVPELPEWVPAEAWGAFVQMRKQIKKPMTPYAQGLMLKRLQKLHQAGHDPQEVLDQSIMHSWSNIYEIKTEQAQAGPVRGVKPQLTLVNQQAAANQKAKELLWGDDWRETIDAT